MESASAGSSSCGGGGTSSSTWCTTGGRCSGSRTNARIESVLMSLPPLAAWEYAPVYEPGVFEAELMAMLEPREWAGYGVD